MATLLKHKEERMISSYIMICYYSKKEIWIFKAICFIFTQFYFVEKEQITYGFQYKICLWHYRSVSRFNDIQKYFVLFTEKNIWF